MKKNNIKLKFKTLDDYFIFLKNAQENKSIHLHSVEQHVLNIDNGRVENTTDGIVINFSAVSIYHMSFSTPVEFIEENYDGEKRYLDTYNTVKNYLNHLCEGSNFRFILDA